MQIGLIYSHNTHATFFMSSSGSTSASLEDLQTCQYKALFSTVLARVPTTEFKAPPLVFGTHLHTAQQIRGYYLLDCVPQLFARLKIPSFTYKSLADLQRKILLQHLSNEPLPQGGKRTTQTLFQLIEDYQTHWAEDPLEFLLFENSQGEVSPLIETPFALPLIDSEHVKKDLPSIVFDHPLQLPFFFDQGPPVWRTIETLDIIYQGAFDAVRAFNGSPYVHDYKTSSEVDPFYFTWREFSNQFTGYVNAARIELGQVIREGRLFTKDGTKIERDIQGITCDKLTFGSERQSEAYTSLKAAEKKLALRQEKLLAGDAKPKDKEAIPILQKEIEELRRTVEKQGQSQITFSFERKPLTDLYTEEHIEFWKRSIIAQVQNLMENHARGVYPQNRSACKNIYGMCPYFQVCIMPPSQHIPYVMGGAFKKRTFDNL